MFSKNVMPKLFILALAAIAFDGMLKAGDEEVKTTSPLAQEEPGVQVPVSSDDQVWENYEHAKQEYKKALIDCAHAAGKAKETADAAKEIIKKERDRKNGRLNTRKTACKDLIKKLGDISFYMSEAEPWIKDYELSVAKFCIEKTKECNVCVTKVLEAIGDAQQAIYKAKASAESLKKEKEKVLLTLKRNIPDGQYGQLKITMENHQIWWGFEPGEKVVTVELSPEEVIEQVLRSAKLDKEFDEMKLLEKAVVPGIGYGLMVAAALAFGRFIGHVNEKYSIDAPSKAN